MNRVAKCMYGKNIDDVVSADFKYERYAVVANIVCIKIESTEPTELQFLSLHLTCKLFLMYNDTI